MYATLYALESSSCVEVVESAIVVAVDFCRLLYALESSSFVEAVESAVVGAVDCCRLLCALGLFKLLNLLLKLLIVVGYIMCSREL